MELLLRHRNPKAEGGRRGKHSLQRKFVLGIGVVTICIVFLSITVLQRVYNDYAEARDNFAGISSYWLVLDAANRISAERGPANVAMASTNIDNAASLQRLAASRTLTDQSQDRLDIQPPSPFGPVPASLLRQVRQQLLRARNNVDHVAALPPAGRRPDDMKSAIANMFEVVDLLRVLTVWRGNTVIARDPSLAGNVVIASLLTDLREYGGRMGSQIIVPVTFHQKLSQEEGDAKDQTRAHLLEIWRTIESFRVLFEDDARVLQAHDEAERLFFGEGVGYIDSVVSQGKQSGDYLTTASELTERYVPTLRTLERFRVVFLDVLLETMGGIRDHAWFKLVEISLATAAILLTLVGLMLSAHFFLFKPLLLAGEAVVDLAEEREVNVTDPAGIYGGEMLRLFDAIGVLRGKLSERSELTRQLKNEAETDGLTGISNRRVLDFVGENGIGEAAAPSARCLILLDVDHFKAINDTHGHGVGDLVLKEVASLVRSIVPPRAIVARFGGEEFAVLIDGADLGRAVTLGREIRLALQQHRMVTAKGTQINVTASFGVATGLGGLDGWNRLIEEADLALYRAKSDGRNRVRFFMNGAMAQKDCPKTLNTEPRPS
ncbi:GGDEF domain-containing protein [Rhizobium tubonense]|uniref:GGDEF domain-containing protein n=1 Tax=Rhizobium tubonense TaxID=484088 RepID=UPI0018A85188|nr:diguanylate cyclase [Rhizobium tubonense]